MTFLNEIAIYFQGMSWLVALLMVLGYFLILIELYQPSFGVFGVIGGAIVALSIVLRVGAGDGNIFAQIFISIFIESIAVLIAFLVLLKTAKLGWLKRSPLPEKKKNDNDLSNKYGTALTDINPIGVANIEGEVVDVMTESFSIPQGTPLVASHKQGEAMVVERED